MFEGERWDVPARFPAVTNVVFGAGFAEVPVDGMGRFPGLEAVTLAEGVAEIAPWAFEGCARLRELAIPDSVTNVGERAFFGCTGLERLSVGAGVRGVGAPLFGWWDEAGQTNCWGSTSLADLSVGSPAFYYLMFEGERWDVPARFPAVTNVVFGWRFGDVPEDISYMFPALGAAEIEEAFPWIDSGAESEIAAALNDSRDVGLTNIADIATYQAFVSWAQSVGGYGQSLGQTKAMVKDSPNAWLSFALDAPSLIEDELMSGDVAIVSFEPTGESGTFSLEVAVDGVDIGGGTVDETTLKKNLKKVLGIEGAPTPTPCEFTSDGIDIAVDAPVDGKAKLTVIPPADSDGAFFMRVNVKVK